MSKTYYDECVKCGFKASTAEDLEKHCKREHNLFGWMTMGVVSEEDDFEGVVQPDTL
jgi:Zn ribbon nucleic-acid-binding protein